MITFCSLTRRIRHSNYTLNLVRPKALQDCPLLSLRSLSKRSLKYIFS